MVGRNNTCMANWQMNKEANKCFSNFYPNSLWIRTSLKYWRQFFVLFIKPNVSFPIPKFVPLLVILINKNRAPLSTQLKPLGHPLILPLTYLPSHPDFRSFSKSSLFCLPNISQIHFSSIPIAVPRAQATISSQQDSRSGLTSPRPL